AAEAAIEDSDPAAAEGALEAPAGVIAETTAEPVAEEASAEATEEVPLVAEAISDVTAIESDGALTSPSMGEVAARSDAGEGDDANDAGSADEAGAPVDAGSADGTAAAPTPALRAGPPHGGEGKASKPAVVAEAA
ncbi:helicase, partial [Mesorhizobium sp. BHbdii]